MELIYECLEFQWVESKPNQSSQLPYEKTSVQFNDFSMDNKGKFVVVSMSVSVFKNHYKQSVETLHVMIQWID